MLTEREFADILADTSKRIEGDIVWMPDPQHPGAVRFRVDVVSDTGYPLFMAGWYRPEKGGLGYTLVYRGEGRIYAIDFGHDHTNQSNKERLGRKHKHYWTEEYAAHIAYNPTDITEPWHQPLSVWQQFCAEARIEHRGAMHSPD